MAGYSDYDISQNRISPPHGPAYPYYSDLYPARDSYFYPPLQQREEYSLYSPPLSRYSYDYSPEYYSDHVSPPSYPYRTSSPTRSSHNAPSSHLNATHATTAESAKCSSKFSQVRQQLDYAISLKKRGRINDALVVFERLCREYPQCNTVWIELSRFYIERGMIRKCREVILCGLEMIPGNEALLGKRIKVEERLRNVNGMIECANKFLTMNSSRCEKDIIEATIAIAKLGCGYEASVLFRRLMSTKSITQPIYLDYIRFVFKTENYENGLNMLKKALSKQTKHGPLWFFSFSILEQNHTFFCTRCDLRLRANNVELAYYLNRAFVYLPKDLHWKVNYVAAQAQLRSFTHIRLWTRSRKRLLRSYCETYPGVIHTCFDSLRQCVERCPNDYKWKVWLLAGRVQALAGKRQSAIRCLVRSTEFAPERSTHAVCLELARILDFIGQPATAGEVIQQNILRFPEEWKLVLERINQLLRENRTLEAYHLNAKYLERDVHAGRLWSSFIQFTHQLYGPSLALQIFYLALKYVSRSGEVWCEGARVFLNPISRHFNPHNAQRCLMFAIYFTPQYGDSFIEAIRLSMITSDELLMFGRSNNPCFLSALMSARDYSAIINKCIYADPNYGSCWFRAKFFPLGSAQEVTFRAIKYTAHEVSVISNVYYDAMLALAKRSKRRRRRENPNCIGKYSSHFSYAFPPTRWSSRTTCCLSERS